MCASMSVCVSCGVFAGVPSEEEAEEDKVWGEKERKDVQTLGPDVS